MSKKNSDTLNQQSTATDIVNSNNVRIKKQRKIERFAELLLQGGLTGVARWTGLGDHKRPSKWLVTEPTKELIVILESQSPLKGSAQKSINSIKGGNNSGTFAVEQLAVAYANWISPKFYLQVINIFLDFKSGKLQPIQKQLSTLEILELALVIEKKNIKLTAQVENMTPKVEALNLISTSDGSMCISNTAKDLQLQPKGLFRWLNVNHWIYKRKGNTTWTAYQDKINQGLLEHKVEPVTLPNNRILTTEQVRVTSKGLAKLAYAINKVAA